MTAALIALGYVIGVLLILVIIRLEVSLDRKEKKRVDYRLFISPDEIVELFPKESSQAVLRAAPSWAGLPLRHGHLLDWLAISRGARLPASPMSGETCTAPDVGALLTRGS